MDKTFSLKTITSFASQKDPSQQVLALALTYMLLFSLVDDQIALNTTKTDLLDKTWRGV